MNSVQVGRITIGPDSPLTIIAGPCVAESYALCLEVGSAVRDRCAKLGLGYIFKASFDKANRSSGGSYRGPGLDGGLALLKKVGKKLGVPVTTDVHDPGQAAAIARAVDLLQVPAFLCRQTDLLLACAATGRPVNVKKGQFLSPAEMTNVVQKVVGGQSDRMKAQSPKSKVRSLQPTAYSLQPGLILTERGTFFGYNRLVNDFVGLGDMLELGWPVCFDITHSTQQPGGQGKQSGGRPERAPLLARCAIVAGVQAIFLETHPDPANAKSDAASMLPLERALTLLDELARLRAAVDHLRR
jgi:2-dehydro-3-deoxyphosphooctonate aldolase (KDO 8-P synthase)